MTGGHSMKSRRKKDKPMAVEQTDEADNEFVDLLAEAVAEEAKEQRTTILEPFEQYAQNLREKVHTDIAVFRARFVKGYHVLLDEIYHDHEEHGKRKSDGRAHQ